MAAMNCQNLPATIGRPCISGPENIHRNILQFACRASNLVTPPLSIRYIRLISMCHFIVVFFADQSDVHILTLLKKKLHPRPALQ